jgi:hypothetical protein
LFAQLRTATIAKIVFVGSARASKNQPATFHLFSSATAQTIEQGLRYRERNRALLNQIFKSFRLKTADVDPAFAVDDLLRKRLADGGGVFESMA